MELPLLGTSLSPEIHMFRTRFTGSDSDENWRRSCWKLEEERRRGKEDLEKRAMVVAVVEDIL